MKTDTFAQHITNIRQKLTQAPNEPEELRIFLFGKKQGLFSEAASLLRELSPEEKPAAGQKLQELREEMETLLTEAENTPSKTEWLDPTLPAADRPVGRLHPLSQAINEITDIFEKIGFTRVRYPEVEWDHYAFEALNMPSNHPARDEWETFFMNAPEHSQLGKMVLTPHTSNGQVREMERLNSEPPIRMINIGRTYRRQQDVTHTQMFHQFEGLVVDKNITIQHLKGTIDHFAKEFYGPDSKSRIRPFHFKFTEPSFEIDFSCTICKGTGQLNGETCRFCKSGWHEVGGAGMVHPNVLRAGGIDPEKYTGFAFGWGVERTYALRPGLHLDDIRLLFTADPRFLEQF
ncbi:phenylalanine--tRNA ligase subunit alpha [Candidatus Woesebacteria bacterium]|nr:phenylalanine--tRNA ligase subunit alpha [Candidatus Woesebacteria bacterium]MCD8526600.1 phenylalanine--tRNA ligase subunit alpha [Candidatus Woesebacteria bacterium]MCD8545994.1 phenylalanine--tRNA ligase subunit alpha [Candidatus Woesebacteria bacterium]